VNDRIPGVHGLETEGLPDAGIVAPEEMFTEVAVPGARNQFLSGDDSAIFHDDGLY